MMNKLIFQILFLGLSFIMIFCNKEIVTENKPEEDKIIKYSISHQGSNVDVFVDKPDTKDVKALLVLHGTVNYDSLILTAAKNTLEEFKKIVQDTSWMIVSVAYPEEGLLMGDNIRFVETALHWLKHDAAGELGVNIEKIVVAGHSQGGYLSTRINKLQYTDGIVANAPGPLNLFYRCSLEENGQVPPSQGCTLIRRSFGTTAQNPNAYETRSLLNFTDGFYSDMLIIQGMTDTPIQLYSWPLFKEKINQCQHCEEVKIIEIPGLGHGALFQSEDAKNAFNDFLNSR
jgi:hypothetical protein